MAELERTDLHVSRGAAVEEEDAGLARGSPDEIGIAWHTGHCQHKAAQLVAAHHVCVRVQCPCDMQASLSRCVRGVRAPERTRSSALLVPVRAARSFAAPFLAHQRAGQATCRQAGRRRMPGSA